MKRLFLLLAVVGALALAVIQLRPRSAVEPMGAGQAEVIVVIDGDTVILDFGTAEETVRLLGIDTPETVHPNLPEQCYGAEAATALAELLPPGTKVRAERDIEARDRYDRLLLHLFRLDDDLYVNRWMVANGYADTSFYEPNLTYQSVLDQARSQARVDKVGLWASCEGPDQPINPTSPAVPSP